MWYVLRDMCLMTQICESEKQSSLAVAEQRVFIQ